MNLYELTDNYKRLLEDIENGDIPAEAIKDTLDAVEGELDAKLENIACYVKSVAAEEAAIKNEVTALQERQKSKHNEATRMMDYMHTAMNEAGKAKLETARCKISIKQNPESVNVGDIFIAWAEQNNKALLTYAPPTANKTAIKELLKAGTEIPGCIITRGERIEVK